MALQNKRNDLLAAWSSLKSLSATDGWRTIPISYLGSTKVLAGRCYPANVESILVGFKTSRNIDAQPLPSGKGFLVCEANFDSSGDANTHWIAINKKTGSNIDFFLMMALDLIDLIGLYQDLDGNSLYKLFISRIKSWQDFMNRDHSGKLSFESEIGLFGELELFSRLSKLGVSVGEILNSWKGPKSALHDYVSFCGAIEVKSTTSSSSFNVTIGSLDQLDVTRANELYLVGFRFAEGDGETLVEKIHNTRKLFGEDLQLLELFNNLLLEVGYISESASEYTKKYSCETVKVFDVIEGFPALTRKLVQVPIVEASYKLNLDLIETHVVEFSNLKNIYGVVLNGAN
jgi:hypothetical protein